MSVCVCVRSQDCQPFMRSTQFWMVSGDLTFMTIGGWNSLVCVLTAHGDKIFIPGWRRQSHNFSRAEEKAGARHPSASALLPVGHKGSCLVASAPPELLWNPRFWNVNSTQKNRINWFIAFFTIRLTVLKHYHQPANDEPTGNRLHDDGDCSSKTKTPYFD